ncbi:unnamed protein product (macronuclear) [Paramecium tetraurelia]|uniref:CSC1/OSCA1-like cytosolic domain-containing protein n=1 Tax=Paramecium tetraurelia TaxID=5888 RepID=A0C3U4_PARTE|nr:uncharacterized protein GSPATT00034940001 [Paramecium tetraurelia]CAK65461.1 unnamed protein product [Paramecium tetraurelia]|eukprot:XP_001432858.1 hypothetical protein (macronuclear) [Paramecium tetraurelia strain d4-2]
MDTNKSEFIDEENLLKAPPNFLLAEKHCKAQIIHQEVISNSQRCPCCNLHVETIKYSLLTDINTFVQEGTAYKYLLFIKNYKFVTLQQLLINLKGDSCIMNETCKQNLNNYLSILNRMDSYFFEDNILDILYLTSTAIQLAFLRYISYSKDDDYNIDRELDSEFTISKCSLKIKNLPSNCNQKEGLSLFVNNLYKSDNDPLNIIDSCLIYDEEYLENQLKFKIKEILTQNNDSSLRDVIERTVDLNYVLQNREFFLKYADRGFITFASEREAIKFKDLLNRKSVIDCPRPSDEKWITKKQKVNLILETILFIIEWVCFYLIYLFQNIKDEYTETNSGYQLNSKTLLSFSMPILQKISITLQQRTYQKVLQYSQFTQLPQYYFEIFQLLISSFNVVAFPLLIFEQRGQQESKLKFWGDGGFNEDIIFIIVISSISFMGLSIIDQEYAWKLLKTFYYKYLNRNSTLTQFEANQLIQRKLDFNAKYIGLLHLIFSCSYYGYIYPICYPITLIALFIIFWQEKYQLINYGVQEEFKFKKDSLKLPILLLFIFQVSSPQLIHNVFKISPTTRPFFYIFLFLIFLLIYLFFFSDLIFINQSSDYQTAEALMKSLEHNDLYSKYNPIINETLWPNKEYEKGLHQHKFSRQERYYNTLKVKLLRELENEFQQVTQNQINQNSIKKVSIQPIQGEQMVVEE